MTKQHETECCRSPRTIHLHVMGVHQWLSKPIPIDPMLSHIMVEPSDSFLVGPFYLTITLEMIGGSFLVSDVYVCPDGSEELRDELKSIDGQWMLQCTTWDDPMVEEDWCLLH